MCAMACMLSNLGAMPTRDHLNDDQEQQSSTLELQDDDSCEMIEDQSMDDDDEESESDNREPMKSLERANSRRKSISEKSQKPTRDLEEVPDKVYSKVSKGTSGLNGQIDDLTRNKDQRILQSKKPQKKTLLNVAEDIIGSILAR
jgi:hypothetical protein